MKIETLIKHEGALRELGRVSFESAQLAWDLSAAIDKAQELIKKGIDKRDALIREHGTPDPGDPNKYFVRDTAKVQPELEKLNAVEVKVDFPKVSIAMLNGAAVTPDQISAWKKLGILTK